MEFGPKCIQDPPVPTLQSKTPVKFEDLKKLKISDLDKILNDLNLPKGKLKKVEKIKLIIKTVEHSSQIFVKYSKFSWYFELF